MKAKLPKKIRVGHRVYSTSRVNELAHKGKDLWGHHLGTQTAIHINTDIPDAPTECEVVIHELLHAVFDHYNLDQLRGMDGDLEEMLVSSIANGMTTIFATNPALLTYINQSVKESK